MIDQNLTLGDAQPFGSEWQVRQELGRGSYGIVYRITRSDAARMDSAMKWIPLPENDRQVARMLAEGATLSEVRESYARMKTSVESEISLLARMRGYSHIVSLEDYKIIPRTGENAVGYDIFIRMELLTPLSRAIAQEPFSFRRVITLGQDICQALADCAHYSIIHRDIKPDNIFVTDDGRFKLGDFGIARRLEGDDPEDAQRMGSLAYMAPEVYQGKPYDGRVDIYSLGLVLYRMLNRMRDPFSPDGDDLVTPEQESQALAARMSGKPLPPPARLPEALIRIWDVVRKACAYDPDDRYPTPQAMADALAALTALPGLDEDVIRHHGPGATTSVAESSEISGTAKRTPSSLLNGTGPRPTPSWHATPTPEKKPVPSGSVADELPTGKKKPALKKWLPIVLAACAALAVAAVLLIPRLKPAAPAALLTLAKAEATALEWRFTADDGAPRVARLLFADTPLRVWEHTGSTLRVEGLTPATAYVIELGDGEARAEAQTAAEVRVEGLPLLTVADLETVNVGYVGRYGSLLAVPTEYFDIVTGSPLSLRAGPMSAQTVSVSIWLQFGAVPQSATHELVAALYGENGPVYSLSFPLTLAASDARASYPVEIDALLDQVYTALGNWPKAPMTMRLYLDGMSVYSLDVQF